MNLVNYMEQAASTVLEDLLQDPTYDAIRADEQVRLDILAFALNRLPPKYFVTEKGQIYTRVQELRQQFRTDILVELTTAIQQVTSHPR